MILSVFLWSLWVMHTLWVMVLAVTLTDIHLSGGDKIVYEPEVLLASLCLYFVHCYLFWDKSF